MTSTIYAQKDKNTFSNNDSLKTSSNEFIKPNTLIQDWKFFNYPMLPYSTNSYFYGSFFPTYPLNSSTIANNFSVSKEEMLAQFRSQQNWSSKNKFSVFTKYLGYAQFLGAMSLLGIHISQWSNLKNSQPTTPNKSFNRYEFK